MKCIRSRCLPGQLVCCGHLEFAFYPIVLEIDCVKRCEVDFDAENFAHDKGYQSATKELFFYHCAMIYVPVFLCETIALGTTAFFMLLLLI